MADLTRSSVSSSSKQPGAYSHDEVAPTAAAAENIAYDRNGVRGIVRSPFVLGAALLASFGGFSFGYGRIPWPFTIDVVV